MTSVYVADGNNSVISLSSSELVKELGISELSEEVSSSPNKRRLRTALAGVKSWGSDGPTISCYPLNVGIFDDFGSRLSSFRRRSTKGGSASSELLLYTYLLFYEVLEDFLWIHCGNALKNVCDRITNTSRKYGRTPVS